VARRLYLDVAELDGHLRRRATVVVAVAAGVLDDVGVNRLGHDRLAGVVVEQHGSKNDLLAHEARDLCRDLATALAQVQQPIGERLNGPFAAFDQLSRARVLEQGGGAARDAAVACHGVKQLVALLCDTQNLGQPVVGVVWEQPRILLPEPLHVAVIDGEGHDLDDREFPTTPAGYRRALASIVSYGEPIAVGVEGTSSYGAGLTRVAVEEGFVVVEVVRPERAERRRLGKSDPIDAYQAARAAMGTHRIAPAKDASIEGIRALHNARRSAMKARTAAMRQIYQQLITAPVAIREKYRDLGSDKRVAVLARMHVRRDQAPLERAVLLALKTLARRCVDLQREHDHLGIELDWPG